MKLVVSSSFSISLLGVAFWALSIVAPLGTATANAEDYVGGGRVPPPPRPSHFTSGEYGGPMEYYDQDYDYEEARAYNYEAQGDYAFARGEEGPIEMVASNHYYYDNNRAPQQAQRGNGGGVRGGTIGRTPPVGHVLPGSIEAQTNRGPKIGKSTLNTIYASVWALPGALNSDHTVQIRKDGIPILDLDESYYEGIDEDGYEYYEGEVQAAFANECITFFTRDNSGNGFAGVYINFYVADDVEFKVADGTVYCYPRMGCGDGTEADYLDHDQRGATSLISYDYAPKKIQWSVNAKCIV